MFSFVVCGSSCQVYPSEYAYHRDSVYRRESDSANCKNYQLSLTPNSRSRDYIHCDGTPLRLTDSDIGSEQYTTSDYYMWPAETKSQVLFIFPTRVYLTTITLHYNVYVYSGSDRGLPRLRFYAVPGDFDVWDAPTTSHTRVEVAAVPPGEEPAGIRNISVGFNIVTIKILMHISSSVYSFALSEVEFISDFCGGSTTITTISEDSKKSSDYLTTTLHLTESDVTVINTSSGTSGKF